jgi:hypothetical protein
MKKNDTFLEGGHNGDVYDRKCIDILYINVDVISNNITSNRSKMISSVMNTRILPNIITVDAWYLY